MCGVVRVSFWCCPRVAVRGSACASVCMWCACRFAARQLIRRGRSGEHKICAALESQLFPRASGRRGVETNAPWSHRNPRPCTSSASLGTCLVAFPATLGTCGASAARGTEGSSAPTLRTECRSASMRSPWLAALPPLCATERRSMQKAHARSARLSAPPCSPPTKMDSHARGHWH